MPFSDITMSKLTQTIIKYNCPLTKIPSNPPKTNFRRLQIDSFIYLCFLLTLTMTEKIKNLVEERIKKGVQNAGLRTPDMGRGTQEEGSKIQEETIRKEIEEKTRTIEEYTNTLKRLQAEFENYTKRVDKEKQEYAIYATEKLILKLLHVLDSFEQAIKNSKEDDAHTKGIKMIFEQFRKTLEDEGLQRLESLHKEYNIEEHEALLIQEHEDTTIPENTVIEEIQTGYKLKNKVLRPARAILSKSKQHIEGGK